VYLYSALFVVPHTQGAQAWITQCYLELHQCVPLPRKRSPDGASPDSGCTYLTAVYYSLIYPEMMKGWVGLVGLPTADGLPTEVVTHQLQVERRTGKVRRSKTDVLPTVPRNQTTELALALGLSSSILPTYVSVLGPSAPTIHVLMAPTVGKGQLKRCFSPSVRLSVCPSVAYIANN